MSKIKSIATLATVMALGASAISAGTRDIHKFGEFFQNVKAEHVQPLLGGAAFVSEMDFEGDGEVAVYWFGRDGMAISCQGTPSLEKDYGIAKWAFSGAVQTNKFLRTKYPVLQINKAGKNEGFQHISYDASTGSLTNYVYQNLRLWEMRTGHLQSELPAVTWELCHDFPSAKSLGARVNKKQTAKYYLDLIKQDPGTRVMKPEYEAKEPPIVRLDLDFQPMPAQDR